MSRSDQRVARWLMLAGTVYAAAAAGAVLRPRAVVGPLNAVGGEPISGEEPPGLYNALAAGYLATSSALALYIAGDPSERTALLPPLLTGNAASSAALLYRYARTRRRGFAAVALINGFIFGVTAGLCSALDD